MSSSSSRRRRALRWVRPTWPTSASSISTSTAAHARRRQAHAKARITENDDEAEASVNKSVMSQVTEQVATENSEKAVEMRDKGDMAGARKVLEDNAAYLNKQRGYVTSGAAPAPAASAKALDDLERKSREAANSLEGEAWDKTRKAMRYDQHKSKVQQAY